jgi:hypothetical protein
MSHLTFLSRCETWRSYGVLAGGVSPFQGQD